MKNFVDSDFLLTTQTAKALYHGYATACPIIDYHSHVSPKEIYEDKHFDNITQLWLSADHYKWRIMRSNGVDEHFITGDATDREKFQKFAEALPSAIGNPMYHWCHLELKNYFGYEGILNGDTAEKVWLLTKEKLKSQNMGVRGLITRSRVAYIGTTDDPVDTLEWHKKLAGDETFTTTVAPTFRPDRVLDINKKGWREYIDTLSGIFGCKIDNLIMLENALEDRMNYFSKHGCRISDHGLDEMVYASADRSEIEAIFKNGIFGNDITDKEVEKFKTWLMIFCAEKYAEKGWVMQIHYNCLRNPNTAMFEKIGADTGFDCIGTDNSSEKLAKFLDVLNSRNKIPKTILYSLDSSDNAFIDTLIGSFQGAEVKGKLQHGCAWWFNDNKQGMTEHLTSLANLGLLGNFVGMLTDSRSFVSYVRHEYFRRILCDLIGKWVENGEYPNNLNMLGKIIKDICFYNAVHYFGLES